MLYALKATIGHAEEDMETTIRQVEIGSPEDIAKIYVATIEFTDNKHFAYAEELQDFPDNDGYGTGTKMPKIIETEVAVVRYKDGQILYFPRHLNDLLPDTPFHDWYKMHEVLPIAQVSLAAGEQNYQYAGAKNYVYEQDTEWYKDLEDNEIRKTYVTARADRDFVKEVSISEKGASIPEKQEPQPTYTVKAVGFVDGARVEVDIEKCDSPVGAEMVSKALEGTSELAEEKAGTIFDSTPRYVVVEDERAKTQEELSHIYGHDINPNHRIWICPNIEVAQNKKDQLEAEGLYVATVEAEYGDDVVEASKDWLTLAHHGSRSSNPAPCEEYNIPICSEYSPGAFILSHLDLDAIGGVLALEGRKPDDEEFWKAAAFIDVNGPHHMEELPKDIQDKLNAVYAWSETQEKINTRELKEPLDVTDQVAKWQKALDIVLDERHPEHETMIEAGRKWVKEERDKVERNLVYENENVRVFVSDGPFCNQNYRSPNTNKIVPAIVTRNAYGGITLSFEDGGKDFSAREIVQSLWGKEAGGRDGVAGSPRNQQMTPEDLVNVAKAVNEEFVQKQHSQAYHALQHAEAQEQYTQEANLDDVKGVDTSKMKLTHNVYAAFVPSRDPADIAEQLTAKYVINDGEIACEPTPDGIKMYLKAIQEIADRTSEELSGYVFQASIKALERLNWNEKREQNAHFEKDVRAKVITEPQRNIEPFRLRVGQNIEAAFNEAGYFGGHWIVEDAQKALDKVCRNSFNLDEAIAACEKIEVTKDSGTEQDAAKSTEFLHDAVAKVKEEIEKDEHSKGGDTQGDEIV